MIKIPLIIFLAFFALKCAKACDEDDLEDICLWSCETNYYPCMSVGDSLNWCEVKK